MKQKKALIFFSAGLGDAVLLIPLIKHLKKRGFAVTGFFNSAYSCEDIFSKINLLDHIVVSKNKLSQIKYSLTHFFKFDRTYINNFASTHKNLLLACLCSKEIFTNIKIKSYLQKVFQSKINYINPLGYVHDAEQNLNLLPEHATISLQDFYIELPFKKDEIIPPPFWAIQISAGNNKATYKNWPAKYFIDFLGMLIKEYPTKNIVLLGDGNETEIASQITHKLGTKVVSLVGKTSILEAMEILAQSELFIGLDGGLMHLAVALKKPTFTFWGPSSTILYGYERFSSIHKCVSLNLTCSPCSAWINANHSKAMSPELCPDHACMQQLLPQYAFKQFGQYVTSLHIHAS